MLDDVRGASGDHALRRYVRYDDRTRGDDRTATDAAAFEHHCIRPDEHLILHDDGEHARYFLSFGGGKK